MRVGFAAAPRFARAVAGLATSERFDAASSAPGVPPPPPLPPGAYRLIVTGAPFVDEGQPRLTETVAAAAEIRRTADRADSDMKADGNLTVAAFTPGNSR